MPETEVQNPIVPSKIVALIGPQYLDWGQGKAFPSVASVSKVIFTQYNLWIKYDKKYLEGKVNFFSNGEKGVNSKCYLIYNEV